MIPFVDYSKCEGCEACAELYPEFFVMKDDRAWVVNYELFVVETHAKVVYACPYGAITIE
ncbi:MAG: ferredoxin [Chloroflexota bacterium]